MANKFQSTRPVWGATATFAILVSYAFIFQSTRPVWGATKQVSFEMYYWRISIHAPRVGRELMVTNDDMV